MTFPADKIKRFRLKQKAMPPETSRKMLTEALDEIETLQARVKEAGGFAQTIVDRDNDVRHLKADLAHLMECPGWIYSTVTGILAPSQRACPRCTNIRVESDKQKPAKGGDDETKSTQ